MKPTLVVIAVLALAAGFGVGFLVRGRPVEAPPVTQSPPAADAVEDARAALDELVEWRGVGALGTRRAMDLVARIVPGGQEVLPDVAEAARRPGKWTYGQLGLSFSFDWRAGVVSQYPSRKVALLEAAHKIGGQPAEQLLMERAEKEGDLTDRVAAFCFLAQHHQRPEVRKFLTDRILFFVSRKRDDAEMGNALKIARGRIEPRAFGPLASAIAAGWARAVGVEMAGVLHALDPQRAEKHFLNVLSKPGQPPLSRLAAARALGRLPAKRSDAVAILLQTGPDELIGEFVKSMRYGRFGEPYLELAARQTGDLQVMLEYTETRVAHLVQAGELVKALARKLGPEKAARFGLKDAQEAYERIIRQAKQRVEELRRELDRKK